MAPKRSHPKNQRPTRNPKHPYYLKREVRDRQF